MLALDRHPATLPTVGLRSTIWKRLSGRGAALIRFFRNRSAYASIAHLTDEQLKDIGLCRYDLKVVNPFGLGDPILHLNRIVDVRDSEKLKHYRLSESGT